MDPVVQETRETRFVYPLEDESLYLQYKCEICNSGPSLLFVISPSQVFHLPVPGHGSGAGDADAGAAGQDVSLPGSQRLGDG